MNTQKQCLSLIYSGRYNKQQNQNVEMVCHLNKVKTRFKCAVLVLIFIVHFILLFLNVIYEFFLSSCVSFISCLNILYVLCKDLSRIASSMRHHCMRKDHILLFIFNPVVININRALVDLIQMLCPKKRQGRNFQHNLKNKLNTNSSQSPYCSIYCHFSFSPLK